MVSFLNSYVQLVGPSGSLKQGYDGIEICIDTLRKKIHSNDMVYTHLIIPLSIMFILTA